MNAPESNPGSQIVGSSPPTVLLETGRALAAIVFTDAANFSAMMRRDELKAQRLIARDLATMRLVCEENNGRVLKTTGDGLLMIFGSAVSAVACALEIQRRLRRQKLSQPWSERLAHRIGIHLGDVFLQENDVIGDGVNVAARLESVGRVGGVCVSGTVFEVVRNRLPFYVLTRKTQKLKNVGKMLIYQLIPVGGRFGFLFKAWHFLRFSDARFVKVAIIVAVVIFFVNFPPKIHISSYPDPLRKYATQLSPLGSADLDSDDDDDDDSPGSSSREPYPMPGRAAASEDEFAVARFNDMKRYDFAAMSAWLGKNDVHDSNPDKLLAACLSIQKLFDWCRTHLGTYNEGNPLVLRDDSGSITSQIWLGAGNVLICKLPATDGTLTGDQIPPSIMAQMASHLLEQDASDDKSSSELWSGLKYFDYAYRVELPSDLKKTLNRLFDPSQWKKS